MKLTPCQSCPINDTKCSTHSSLLTCAHVITSAVFTRSCCNTLYGAPPRSACPSLASRLMTMEMTSWARTYCWDDWRDCDGSEYGKLGPALRLRSDLCTQSPSSTSVVADCVVLSFNTTEGQRRMQCYLSEQWQVCHGWLRSYSGHLHNQYMHACSHMFLVAVWQHTLRGFPGTSLFYHLHVQEVPSWAMLPKLASSQAAFPPSLSILLRPQAC